MFIFGYHKLVLAPTNAIKDSEMVEKRSIKTGASRARPANVSLQRLLSEPKVVLTVTKRVLGFGVACGVCTLVRK